MNIDWKDLNKEEQGLVESAKEARDRAYSPINNIFIGSALLDESGEVVQGANFGVSSGLNICAERAVIVTANSLGIKNVTTLALYSDSEDPIIPCGPCRQFIFETGMRNDKDITILSSNRDYQKILKFKLSELYPHPYRRV